MHRPITVADRAGKKNEIFVDVLERLTVLFNSNVRASLQPLCLLLLFTVRALAGLHSELSD